MVIIYSKKYILHGDSRVECMCIYTYMNVHIGTHMKQKFDETIYPTISHSSLFHLEKVNAIH